MKSRILRSILGAALLAAAGTASASPQAGAPPECAPAPPPATEALPALAGELVWVQSQGVEVWTHRVERPRATLVFENGLMLPLTTWQKVVQALAGEANILLYNRPGVGRSSVPDLPPDATSTARLLHDVLQASRLPPPYVAVGHSLGGQYAQLFARLYPQEVSAMLLVDALPPGALKPSAEFPWYTQLGLRLLAPEYVRREIANAHAMGEWLLHEPGSFDKPVIRLIAAPDSAAAKPEGLLKDLLKGVVYAEDFGVWAVDPDVAERRLDAMYPNSDVRLLKAHHRMQEAAPLPVIEAIRELMPGAGCAAG